MADGRSELVDCSCGREVGAQRKRPHKPNHRGGLHAVLTPARLMRLRTGLSTRGSVLGQRQSISYALKLVAKCKAWCGCMSCTGEMKTRTAGTTCAAIGLLATAAGGNHREVTELRYEPRCRKGRCDGEAMSGGGHRRGDARPCASSDDRGPLAATLASRLPFAIQPYNPPGLDQPIRPIDSDNSPLARTLFQHGRRELCGVTGAADVFGSGWWFRNIAAHHTARVPPPGCEHDDAAALRHTSAAFRRRIARLRRGATTGCHQRLRESYRAAAACEQHGALFTVRKQDACGSAPPRRLKDAGTWSCCMQVVARYS
ncbi:hypothetical protein C7974DRAFT_376615 [Boeremia exigua]|uniref:uncharacterized protein n=1 Tax=Boeremia exigua TaxID=749465 RepID=UPI001E8DC30C|nr:uncharacterized protein C7974DRAFT_376615 [Boeremia exigua]KAH6629829.1 hypothetical protein C7974DRAFT_376615 [Boeremia exigua]